MGATAGPDGVGAATSALGVMAAAGASCSPCAPQATDPRPSTVNVKAAPAKALTRPWRRRSVLRCRISVIRSSDEQCDVQRMQYRPLRSGRGRRAGKRCHRFRWCCRHRCRHRRTASCSPGHPRNPCRRQLHHRTVSCSPGHRRNPCHRRCCRYRRGVPVPGVPVPVLPGGCRCRSWADPRRRCRHCRHQVGSGHWGRSCTRLEPPPGIGNHRS